MANGTLKVQNIETSSGSGTITLGQSGETIALGSGVTSKMNHPAFEAYLSSNQSVDHQTFTKIQVDTEVFDTDGCYDNATNYRFTPTVAGKYFIYSSVTADTSTSNMKQFFNQLYKNGVNAADGASINFDNNNGEGGGVTLTTVVDMNGSTDYIELYTYGVTVNAGSFNAQGTTPNKRTLFGAYRLGVE